MWIKIALIFSILASAGTIVLSELKVKTTIETIKAEKTKVEGDLAKRTEEKEKFAKDLAKKQEDLDATTADRDAAKAAADQAMKAAAAEKDNAAKAAAATAAAKAETAKAVESAKQYFELGKTPDDIKKTYAELPTVKAALDIATEERRIIAVRERKVTGELDAIKNAGKTVVLPEGVKGKIVVVDPKWEFCVVDIGGNHGLIKNGELLVSRGGKVIGRLKVDRVEPSHATAVILPQWKRKGEEVTEGDEVLVP